MNTTKKLQELINNSDNIVFFGGAGVSTESGIKDFRGKNGLYKEELTSSLPPEYMLSKDCLFDDTELFFDYYKKKMNCSNIEPNITHKYLKELEDRGKLKAIVTQNIDGLHQKAGSTKVYELHGTTNRCYCVECKKEYTGDYIFNAKGIPKCKCGGMVRPDVVLYGEQLPDAYQKAAEAITNADLLIVAGTSLTVMPAGGLIHFFKGKHMVIINNMETPFDYFAELVINKSLGEVFSKLK